MTDNTVSQLNDYLVFALQERPSTVTVSSTADGRYRAGYIFDTSAGRKGKEYASGDTANDALNSLSRKVQRQFHPDVKKTDGE